MRLEPKSKPTRLTGNTVPPTVQKEHTGIGWVNYYERDNDIKGTRQINFVTSEKEIPNRLSKLGVATV